MDSFLSIELSLAIVFVKFFFSFQVSWTVCPCFVDILPLIKLFYH